MSVSPQELELQELHQQLHKLRALLPQFLQSLSGADDGQSGRELYYTVARGIRDWRREVEAFLERWRTMGPIIENLLGDGSSDATNPSEAAGAGAGAGTETGGESSPISRQALASNGTAQTQSLEKANNSTQNENNGSMSDQGMISGGLDDFTTDPGLYGNDFLDFT